MADCPTLGIKSASNRVVRGDPLTGGVSVSSKPLLAVGPPFVFIFYPFSV